MGAEEVEAGVEIAGMVAVTEVAVRHIHRILNFILIIE